MVEVPSFFMSRLKHMGGAENLKRKDMMVMTLDDLRKEKSFIEKSINDILSKFEDRTGVYINDVNFCRVGGVLTEMRTRVTVSITV